MFSNIDPRSPTPLYDQIASRVRIAIAAGELAPGHALPSVRQLATKLRVNPATVVQAYRELAADGFVEMRQGAGTFVRDVTSDRRESERSAQARNLVRTMLSEAARRGLTTTEMATALSAELGSEGE
jgi:GntR family transcriptional regulator